MDSWTPCWRSCETPTRARTPWAQRLCRWCVPAALEGSPVWRRLKDALSGDELERGGAAADVCGALDALADRVPTERDVSVSVVWLCGARLPAPERSGLLSALLRWRLWLGALSGAPSTVINLQASCDTAAWEQLTAAAAAMHDGQSAALALLDGAEVVAEIGADSVPAAALTDCRLRLQRLGAAAAQQERCGWGDGRTALLVRLLAAPVGDGDRRRDAEDWRRMAVDGRPPDRRAPPPAARPLHFVITAGADGDGLMTLLAAAEVAALPHQPPELSLSELRALAAGIGWAAATELTEFRQRLAKAIQGALGEHGVGARDTMYRSCARKLATIVRAYLQDVKGAGETSARQMLQLARVHVKHVIQVQRELQGTS
ncbi:hypothetical protein FJT64_003255 [Amphibalanus amphitrite]|uniref:Uncharacterized protein n=1 Tax=Amphibalanus amphitrite TaxID=1232801 RepID=A0A6A4WD00_AMPAM|nr:hypothetical protein FJT64_003255 [Amphibalanus amphitrite]